MDDQYINITEGDVEITRFELRIGKKKPIVVEKPTLNRLVTVTMSYVGCSNAIARSIIGRAVLDTSDPELEEYFDAMNTIKGLEELLASSVSN
ncbi:hypothetical protein VCHA53O466_50416 [Vibrio chagasii]|nr:hypothetical protein VCHA53O466_50416 [Vibrio chagasii]